jgi:hypothetical protein
MCVHYKYYPHEEQPDRPEFATAIIEPPKNGALTTVRGLATDLVV